ncbi:MAG: phosphoglycerate kinase [Actinomycetota bacterium]
MRLRTLDDLGDVAGKTVFLRADFNVPLESGKVADDARIRATVPTIVELLDRGTTLVVASHLGRPKGKVKDELRMEPVASQLRAILEREVEVLGFPGTLSADAAAGEIDDATVPVIVLENLRFDAREEANDTSFAGELAALADVYVDDAFGASHRAHASVSALPELMVASGRPAVAGRLLQKEVEVLSNLLDHPEKPYVAVLGGAKISDKLGTISALSERADALLIGGAMAFTLIAADGGEIGDSLVEPDRFDDVRRARKQAEERGVLIQLPEDVVAASDVSVDAERSTVPADAIPKGRKGLDVGPRTVEEFARTIADAHTILWNGPMGVFELEPFSAGTRGVATAIAGAKAYSVVGGGDSLLAVKRLGLEESFDHLSTGGGASLEFLEGKTLPGIEVLEER